MTATLKGSIDDQNTDIYILFDIITVDEVEVTSEVTDHVVEDGSTRQEHIVQPPIKISLEGLCAEKTFQRYLPDKTSRLASAVSKLKPISSLIPIVSSYAQTVVATSEYIENAYNKYKTGYQNLKAWLNGEKITSPYFNRQLSVYKILNQLRNSNTLVAVKDTPYGKFDNMLITSVNMKQEETTDVSRLVVQLKQYNSVSTELTKIDSKKYATRCALQQAATEDLGNMQGKRMSILRSAVSPNIVPYFTGLDQ